jgi:two-component system, NarL family, sensor histidine kinase DevS
MAAEENPDDALTASADVSGTAEGLGIGFAWVIVELAPDGILVSDNDGRIMMANRHIEELFGYKRDTLVGAPVESLLPARLRRTHVTHRARYVTAPTLRPMGVGLELFGCHADGSEFPIEVSLSPVATEQGVATVVVIRDVTEQRALEREAREASALDHDERIAADLHDRVIGHLFGCGLTLASVLGRNQLDDRIAEQLHGVIDELDTAVQQIRNAAFARLAHKPDLTQAT